jgi:hypothetical protein
MSGAMDGPAGESPFRVDIGTPDDTAGSVPEGLSDGRMRGSGRAKQNDRRLGPRRAHVVNLGEIESREVDWLWPGRLPAGMIAVLDGPPSAGKSTIVIDIVARLTTGRPLPDEPSGDARPAVSVVLLGHEDSPEHTIRPRLDAAGADAGRVHLLADVGGRMPRLPDDAEEIERLVGETGARLVVIDPVSAYLGQADLHRDNDVRVALAPLALLAERTGAAVLMLRHLRKSGGTDALGRGLGSVAIIAVARAGLMLLEDPDDRDARILAWSKMSVGPRPASLRWRWQQGSGPPRVSWEGTCNHTADEILARQDRALRGGDPTASTAVNSAEAWLMEQFEEADAIPANELKERATRDRVAWRTVERAKGCLGIRARRENLEGGHGAGRWMWAAPD